MKCCPNCGHKSVTCPRCNEREAEFEAWFKHGIMNQRWLCCRECAKESIAYQKDPKVMERTDLETFDLKKEYGDSVR